MLFNCVMCVMCVIYFYPIQDGFCPTDVEFRSLQTMSKQMMNRMLPEAKVNVISLHEGTYLLTSILFVPSLKRLSYCRNGW